MAASRRLSRQFFLWLTLGSVVVIGPLVMWHPFICDLERDEKAVPFAEAAKSSKVLFASCLTVLASSVTPLLDAIFDMLRLSQRVFVAQIGAADAVQQHVHLRDRPDGAVGFLAAQVGAPAVAADVREAVLGLRAEFSRRLAVTLGTETVFG